MSMPSGVDTNLAPRTVTVRVAEESDAQAVMRLAALDSATAPDGPALVAEVDGHAVAALPLDGGRAVADPFRRSSALIEMLELHAAHLRGDRPARHSQGPYAARLRSLVRIPRPAQPR